MATRRRFSEHGFTLIELVIVIAVISILAALLVPTILGQVERGRISSAKSNVQEMTKALGRMREDTHFHDDDAAVATSRCYALKYLAAAKSLASPTSTEPACGDAELPPCSAQGPNEMGEPCWGGPYLHQLPAPQDPWGSDWVVSYEPSTRSLTVMSPGPDKDPNATSDNIFKSQ